MSASALKQVEDLLGSQSQSLLGYTAKGFSKEQLQLPGPDFVDRVLAGSDRSPSVLRTFQTILNTGRPCIAGFFSILPVDQGIEHWAGASFAPEPIYFD